MKGIALICRQIGHLDSVWFLMPNDTVMTLSLSLSLSASLSHSYYQSLLAERFSSSFSLAHKIRGNERKKTKKEKNIFWLLLVLLKMNFLLPSGDILGVCVSGCVCYCVSHVRCEIVLYERVFPLFIKEKKYSMQLWVAVCDHLTLGFFSTHSLEVKWQNDSESRSLLKRQLACHSVLW